MVIDTSKLEIYLKKKLEDEVEDEWSDMPMASFTSDGPPTCSIELHPLEKWFGIKALVNYKGSTMDPSTDRASGDPEDAHAWYDWLGLAEDLPKSVEKTEDLDNWALIHTYYRVTFRDVQYPGPFGHHSGRLIKSCNLDGKGEIYVVVEKYFRDEAPISKCKVEEFDLNKIAKI
ncbi:MAG: hypothetical protein FK734_18600 [Asgard group archaeon]|nr:hypothetical protein [Asgard group archaeon]